MKKFINAIFKQIEYIIHRYIIYRYIVHNNIKYIDTQ